MYPQATFEIDMVIESALDSAIGESIVDQENIIRDDGAFSYHSLP